MEGGGVDLVQNREEQPCPRNFDRHSDGVCYLNACKQSLDLWKKAKKDAEKDPPVPGAEQAAKHFGQAAKRHCEKGDGWLGW
jgi:hypothetical protein